MVLFCIRARARHVLGRAFVVRGLLVLLALVPRAHARPSDPLWITGIYDAAYHDDVVHAVTDSVGLQLSSEGSGVSCAPRAATRTRLPCASAPDNS